MLLAHREQTLWRIREGEKLIAHQKELASRCREAGLSTDRAVVLLRPLEAAQASHTDYLARVEHGLALSSDLLRD